MTENALLKSESGAIYRVASRYVGHVLVFTASLLLIVVLKGCMRPHAADSLYFQKWGSEELMQTASIIDLRDHPVESLFYLHIQPPALDAIRALSAQIWPTAEFVRLSYNVDRTLYNLWALLYAFSGVLIWSFSGRVSGQRVAFFIWVVWLFHPALLRYATLPDTTILSTVLVLWLFFELWHIKEAPHERSPWIIGTIVVLLFLTRSVFQWPFVLVVAASLLLLHVRPRSMLIYIVVVSIAVGGYTMKQQVVFGTTSTSSFAGYNLNRSIGYNEKSQLVSRILKDDCQRKVQVLCRKRKPNGQINYNHSALLALNKQLQQRYVKRLTSQPLTKTLRSYKKNLDLYFLPSSQYATTAFTERLPWKKAFEVFFSAPVLPLLLVLASLIWLARSRRRDYRYGVAFMLPLAFIVMVCILGEKGENMRFKFFVEPLFLVFIVSQLHSLREMRWRDVVQRVRASE